MFIQAFRKTLFKYKELGSEGVPNQYLSFIIELEFRVLRDYVTHQ